MAEQSNKKWIALAAFILLVLGGGFFIGANTLPGAWYAALNKPFFNPPNWIFAPVWSILYVMIAIAGWRIWVIAPKSALMMIWFAQLVLNFFWSPTFFTEQNLVLAAMIIFAMILLTAIFILLSRKVDKIAAYLMVPYLAWISFAALLNVSLWWLN